VVLDDFDRQRVRLEGHFPGIVRLEDVEIRNGTLHLRVRLEIGSPDET
jgi:hypothetical protein